MNRFLLKGLLLALFLINTNCTGGGSGGATTSSGTSSGVSNGSATVALAATHFVSQSGAATLTNDVRALSEDDLCATFDVLVNDLAIISGANADDYLNSADQVAINLTSVESGDVVEIIIHKCDGTLAGFTVTLGSSSSVVFTLEGSATDGLTALRARELSKAAYEYCNARDNGDTSGGTAFGCFLSKSLHLPQTQQALDLLNMFDQEPVDVANDILADIVEPIVGDDQFGKFIYTNYEALPFTNFLGDSSLSKEQKYAQFAVLANASQTATLDLINGILDLRSEFELYEELLDAAIADSNFEFTVPKELFGAENDNPYEAAWLPLPLGNAQAAQVGLNILEAYDFGLETENAVLSDNINLDHDKIVADLNGSGETVNGTTVDSVAFMTLLDSSLVTSSADKAEEALTNTLAGLSQFAEFKKIDVLSDISNEKAQLKLQALLDSLQNNTLEFIATAHHDREININLKAFFDNPPNAADVTDFDPFVVENDRIKPVEAFFDELFDGAASF